MIVSELVSQPEALVTRVWGFSPESWGAMGFPKAGAADKWLDSQARLRVICFVSHHAAEYIRKADQGRVLGMYELAPRRVTLLEDDVLAEHHLHDPAMRHPDGRFRWPIGLRAERAWKFQPNIPRTREALPDARSWGFDVSTDLVPITARDYALLNQPSYRLVEVPVYGTPFDATRLAAPVAVPLYVYIFGCGRGEMLQRLPGWREGDILIKIGCTSDVDGRLADFNDHPLARIFGLKLAKVAKRYVGEGSAREQEDELLDQAAALGRPACDLSTEFFFVSKAGYRELQMRFATILQVA